MKSLHRKNVSVPIGLELGYVVYWVDAHNVHVRKLYYMYVQAQIQ